MMPLQLLEACTIQPLLQRGALLIGESYLSWIPVWSVAGGFAVVLATVLLWIILRVGWGKSVSGLRIGMSVLRTLAVGLLLMILLGPTIVDEQPGSAARPTLTYLFDGSSSMALGQAKTRWAECVDLVDEAQTKAGPLAIGDCQAFRFGHRLMPLVSTSQASKTNIDSPVAPGNAGLPDATDSRLADAMRQLLPLIDSSDNAGVVLLSDGRVRATESVETLAEYYGQLKIPIHVVPIGEAQGSGDIAIVSLVSAPQVRKYTENEVQVFFRSFGFTGQRTTVRLVRQSSLAASAESTLTSVPVTLSGGAQSATLKFRVEDRPESFAVIVDPVPGELTDRNNRVESRVDIDRTKVRVLYIEGDSSQQSFLGRILQLPSTSVTPTTLRSALQADEDIECVALVSPGGRSTPVSLGNTSSSALLRFPRTRSELFAYDCIVLSNVSPQALEEEDHASLTQWVEGRGGGLIVCGSDSLRPEDWEGSPLASLLPVEFASMKFGAPQSVEVQVTEARHPIWHLTQEEHSNLTLLESMPALISGLREIQVKDHAEILAKCRDDNLLPLLISHRHGRGRIVVSTADIGGRAVGILGTTWGATPGQTVEKFWRNMVYWATEGSSVGRRRLIAESDKRFYRPGEPLSVYSVAYDESARKTQNYRVYGMFEPLSLDDMSTYSPILWPENVVRDSGEVGPRIAWGEELQFPQRPNGDGFGLDLQISESSTGGDGGLRIELTAYEGENSETAFGHGTQVDSTSLQIQILSDPFEQQNPLPNHEFMARIAMLSGGKVLKDSSELAAIIGNRAETRNEPQRDLSPAWSRWWIWLALVGLLTTEWIWRRMVGLA